MGNGNIVHYINRLKTCGKLAYDRIYSCVINQWVRQIYQSQHSITTYCSWRSACFQCYEIALGLAYLHKEGIVHGDLRGVCNRFFRQYYYTHGIHTHLGKYPHWWQWPASSSRFWTVRDSRGNKRRLLFYAWRSISMACTRACCARERARSSSVVPKRYLHFCIHYYRGLFPIRDGPCWDINHLSLGVNSYFRANLHSVRWPNYRSYGMFRMVYACPSLNSSQLVVKFLGCLILCGQQLFSAGITTLLIGPKLRTSLWHSNMPIVRASPSSSDPLNLHIPFQYSWDWGCSIIHSVVLW